MRFGYLGIPSLARTPGRATTFCGGAENDCFVIAFFAEFDPVEYADFDDNEFALDDSQPRLLLVVFPRVFIIIVPQDNDDDVHDDEERFLPNLELVNVFSRKRTPTSDDDDDDALVRVVQYKSIVVVTENAREVYLFVSFFSKKSCPFGGNVRSEKLYKNASLEQHFASVL